MTPTSDATTSRPPVASLRHLAVIAAIALLVMFVTSTASFAQQAPVGLGTADGFAVLGGSTITNTGATTITGDVGLHPGTAVTGFDSVTINGSLHETDAVAEQAKSDLVTAYNDAAGRSPATAVATELGGQTLQGGVYGSGTLGITGTLTLDAAGDPDTVFVFQAASTLITASASDVELVNGADACNVFWQVGSSATLGTGSSLTGTILALTSITLNSGASLEGRALARNGAVTLDTNVITNAACATPTADDEAPVDDTPTDEAPVDETPTGEAPVDDTPTDEAPVDDTPTDEAPVDDTPTDEAPVDETPTDDTPVGDDSSAGQDTPAGEGTPTGSDTPTDEETTSQVRKVPGGSVAAGGGGVDAHRTASPVLVGILLLMVAAGGMIGVFARRRARA